MGQTSRAASQWMLIFQMDAHFSNGCSFFKGRAMIEMLPQHLQREQERKNRGIFSATFQAA
jgi:nuclear transport factor 2 (NTF2) superfamily protein